MDENGIDESQVVLREEEDNSGELAADEMDGMETKFADDSGFSDEMLLLRLVSNSSIKFNSYTSMNPLDDATPDCGFGLAVFSKEIAVQVRPDILCELNFFRF